MCVCVFVYVDIQTYKTCSFSHYAASAIYIYGFKVLRWYMYGTVVDINVYKSRQY